MERASRKVQGRSTRPKTSRGRHALDMDDSEYDISSRNQQGDEEGGIMGRVGFVLSTKQVEDIAGDTGAIQEGATSSLRISGHLKGGPKRNGNRRVSRTSPLARHQRPARQDGLRRQKRPSSGGHTVQNSAGTYNTRLVGVLGSLSNKSAKKRKTPESAADFWNSADQPKCQHAAPPPEGASVLDLTGDDSVEVVVPTSRSRVPPPPPTSRAPEKATTGRTGDYMERMTTKTNRAVNNRKNPEASSSSCNPSSHQSHPAQEARAAPQQPYPHSTETQARFAASHDADDANADEKSLLWKNESGAPMRKIPRKTYASRDEPRSRSLIASTERHSRSDPQRSMHQKRNSSDGNLSFRKVNGPATKRPKKSNRIIPGASLEHREHSPTKYAYRDNQEAATPSSVASSAKPRTQPAERTLRRSKRNSSQGTKKEEEVVDLMSDTHEAAADLLSSSQEELGSIQDDVCNCKSCETSSTTAWHRSMDQVTRIGQRLTSMFVSRLQTPTKTKKSESHKMGWNVSRIAVGKRVLTRKCKVEVLLDEKVLKLSYLWKSSGDGEPKDRQIDLTNGFRYFNYCQQVQDGVDTLCWRFIAFQVEIDTPNKSTRNPRTQDIIVEFSSDKDLQDLLCLFQSIPEVACYTADKCALSLNEADAFCRTLATGKVRHGSANVTDSFVAGRAADTVLLVYPFPGDAASIEKAAGNMLEASGALFSNSGAGFGEMSSVTKDDSGLLRELQNDGGGAAETTSDQRKHYCTIQVRDFERLCPGEYLNDALIDFWMQWITRKASASETSLHFFSSHFCTTLVEDGVQGVEKWTARKGINVFTKKFVFIPINDALHWSLCVVVNPGHIYSKEENDPMACMLFFDSLLLHRKKKFTSKVRHWLNSEWQRINGDDSNPFTLNKDFPLFSPRIPYQNNSWDCGVFVCRYAYSVYCIRDCDFTRNDQWFAKDLIQERDEFKFDINDIARLRGDIRTLVQGLSGLYLPWKKQHDSKLKLERRKEKEERREQLDRESKEARQKSREKRPEQVGRDLKELDRHNADEERREQLEVPDEKSVDAEKTTGDEGISNSSTTIAEAEALAQSPSAVDLRKTELNQCISAAHPYEDDTGLLKSEGNLAWAENNGEEENEAGVCDEMAMRVGPCDDGYRDMSEQRDFIVLDDDDEEQRRENVVQSKSRLAVAGTRVPGRPDRDIWEQGVGNNENQGKEDDVEPETLPERRDVSEQGVGDDNDSEDDNSEQGKRNETEPEYRQNNIGTRNLVRKPQKVECFDASPETRRPMTETRVPVHTPQLARPFSWTEAVEL